MILECPLNPCKSKHIVRNGSYRRKSDSKKIPRFFCNHCETSFSSATNLPTYRQKKRRLNSPIYKFFSSGMSQRRIARVLRCNLKTVARKLQFLSSLYDFREDIDFSLITQVQFDEMETWVHSKLKPVSILIAVDKTNRKILDLRACFMPAKGLIKEKSIKKYGRMKDNRPEMFQEAFSELKDRLDPGVSLESDECPRYPRWVREYFPQSSYERYKGLRGCVVGQGELKGGGFDPLFSLNHTCAMLRANINRLFRRTWCTSKDIQCLQMHLNIYAHYHNTVLV